MLDFGALEPAPIALSTFVGAALGALWYSPVLLGPAWIAALGKSEEEVSPGGEAIAGSVVSCLVAALSIDLLVASTGTSGALAGAGLGAVVGLGVVAMTMLSDSLFSGWGWTLYAIQTSYRAGYLVLMGAISGLWR